MNDRNNILFISLNNHQRRYFRWLGERLSGAYNIFHVHYTGSLSELIGKKSMPSQLNFSKQEIEEIIGFLLIKAQYRQFSGVRKFLHSRQVLTNQAYGAISYFYEYILSHKINLVCVWNGTLVPLAAATRVAQKLGCKTLFFENGYLPGTTTADPRGVNNRSSLVGKPASFYQAVEVDAEKLQTIYQAPASIRGLKEKWFHRLLKKKVQGQPENIELPERYIFLPFQVNDDTQVLLHSPKIKTMRQLVDYVVPAVERYNAATGDNLWVIAKEHPSDFGRIDYSDVRDKYQKANFQLLRYYPTPALIKAAQGIITINSSVGIESLVQHKQVIALGNAFYNIPGIVTHVSPPADLAEVLDVIDQEVNHGLIDKFLYYLRYHYLVEGSWRMPDDRHFASVAGKIANVLKKQ